MSMFSDVSKMEPAGTCEELARFKLKVGDRVAHPCGHGGWRTEYGTVQACLTRYGRRYYDVEITDPRPLKKFRRVIETELAKEEG